jgi:hypothetical protein
VYARDAREPPLIEVVNLGLRRSSEPEEPVLPVAGRIGPPLIR